MSIEELKILQLKIIKKNKICNAIEISLIFVAGLITFAPSYYSGNIDNPILIFLPLSFVIVMELLKKNVNKKDIELFNKNLKKIFVLSALNKFFYNISYFPEKGFDKNFVDSIGMLNTGDSFCSNDYITGSYKNIRFEQSDIHIEEKRKGIGVDGSKKEHWRTVFLGRLMIFDFNKKFKANIQISNYFFNAESLPWGRMFSKIRMDDEEFNEKFCIYAQDEHEAFYVLTPHFMEKLKNIEEKISCGIMFCFIDNKLYVAIDNYEDSFEWDVFKRIDEQQIEENIIRDIKVITEFVDELNLDNDLFRKEV